MNRYTRFLKEVFKMRNLKDLIIRGLELLIGYPIWAISFLTPRNKKKWVFGTNVGFTDNAKYLFIYVNELKNEIKPIWISHSKKVVNEVRELGFKAYRKYSLPGLYHCLTSRIYIFTYHSKDINFFTSGNAKKVNLWHGVGIKGKGGTEKGYAFTNNILSRILLPHIFEKYTLFLSTSPLMNKHFSKIYNIDHRVIYEDIYPRCYYMCKSQSENEKFINKYEKGTIPFINSFKSYKKIYLYMPTWRGNLKDDFFVDAGFNFEELDKKLKEKNALFLLKLHPAVKVLNYKFENYSNIISLDKNMDIYPILNFTDVLITDYSSIYYDYLLLDKKEILLYPFDKEEYIRNSTDLVFDYDEYTPGIKVYNFNDFMMTLFSDINLEVKEKEHIIDLFWGKSDIKDLSPLCNKIKSL